MTLNYRSADCFRLSLVRGHRLAGPASAAAAIRWCRCCGQMPTFAVALNTRCCAAQINPRVSLSMIVKSWAILGTLGLSFYIAFFAAANFLVRLQPLLMVLLTSPMGSFEITRQLRAYPVLQASMAAAVLLGLAMAEVGVSIQHDANHGAYMPRTWWSWLMAASLDAVRDTPHLVRSNVMTLPGRGQARHTDP